MPKKPKKAPPPVPSQDETQFKASMVVDAKPKLKKSDIFEGMTENQKKRAKHRQARKDRMKASKEAKEKKKKSGY
jgi:hypothetical protein